MAYMTWGTLALVALVALGLACVAALVAGGVL